MGRSPRTIREEGRVAGAWALSIVGHLVAVGLGGLAVAASLGRNPALPLSPRLAPHQDDTVEIDLPAVVDGTQVAAAQHPPELAPTALPRGGGEAMPRLDTGRSGRGGTDTSPTPAMNLADRDDQLLLSPDVMSRMDRSQIQRIKASKRRATREDWRASREPMELTFLAEGHKDVDARPERRKYADHDPSSGGGEWGPVRRQGGALGAGEIPPGIGELAHPVGGPVEGAMHASAGRGVRDGAPGQDNRDSAQSAYARPMVNQGTPSVPANVQDRPTDNVDSEQDVATRMQSILHASNAGGALGPGTGGERGPGAAGAGGRDGPGSKASALGTGQGQGLDNDPLDKRRNDYIRRVHAKLGPYINDWHKLMSVATAAEGVQGVVTVTLTIRADGSVASAAITRSSGVAELDGNFRNATLKAGPYPPLPPEFGTTFRLAIPLDMRNPVVRPRTAKIDPI